MPDYYADSSVLVKRHVDETGAAWVRALCAPTTGNVLITARISIAEVYSAFNRRRREARLDLTDYVDLAGDFEIRCAAEYQLVEITSTVIERARTLLERHPLRAYDSVAAFPTARFATPAPAKRAFLYPSSCRRETR